MKQLLMHQHTFTTPEDNNTFLLSYYLTIEEICHLDYTYCESYGILVELINCKGGIESRAISGITPCLDKIEKIVQVMADNMVTPVSLFDALVDYIS